MNIISRLMLMRKIKRQFYWDVKTLKQHQDKRIEILTRYVAKHSPFYKNVKKSGDFPKIDKEIMMANFNTINTCRLDRSELFEIQNES